MAITYEIKYSQTALGKGESNKFFVDESYASTGIGLAKFVSIKADGASKAFNGQTGATWQVASSTGLLPAQGIVYTTSAPKVDRTVSEFFTDKDSNFYPFGDRESQGLLPIQEAEIVVRDTTRDYFFNTAKKPLTGTVSVAGGALSTVVGVGTSFLTELRVGDFIIVGGIEKQVASIASATALDVTEAFAGAVASAVGYIGSDLFKKVYLSTAGGFTKLVPTTVGTLKQTLGYVINGNNVKVDIEDMYGTTL